MKKIKILILLILTLGLFLCFSNVKTEAATSGSYVHVYINGEYKIRCSSDTMTNYINGVGSLNSNGWPTVWMSNSYTAGMTFEVATADLSGNKVWDSFPVFADYFMNECVNSSDIVLMPLYLWFYSNEPKYATINFTCTMKGYSYESQTVTWNVANAFTYSDFPTYFYNETTVKDEKISNGNWFNDDTLTICNDNYSVILEGGKTYNYDYYISGTAIAPVPDFDESVFETADVPKKICADEEYIKLPGYIGGYPVTWSLLLSAASYVEFSYYNDYILLKRLQPLQTSETIFLSAIVSPDGETSYTHTYYFLLEANVIQLSSPTLNIVAENGIASKLVWTAVEKADWYIISYGEDEDEVIGKVAASTTSYYLPGGLEEVGNYNLYVKAVSDSENYLDSSLSNGVTYFYNIDYLQLDTPVLSLDDHTLSWDAIDSVGFYELYCDLKLIKTLDVDTLSIDIYDLDLKTGTYSFRLIAVPKDVTTYANSQYSLPIVFEQKPKSLNFYYNGVLYKTVYSPNVQGEGSAAKNEYFLANLLPTEIALTDSVGIVQGYYLDKELTDKIDSSIIYYSWSAIDFHYLEIYMEVIQPLDYNGPTLIWKNPSSFLDTESITKIVRKACEDGTKDSFILKLIDDGYTGHGDSAGNYVMSYECKVGDYVSTINLTIRVSASIKVDYLYNDTWYCSTIVEKPDIVSTAKAVGALPDTELSYTIVTYHNETSVDYYSTKPSTGIYSFLITYNSTAGSKGIYRFEMNYNLGIDYEIEEESNILPIILKIGGITLGVIIIVVFYKKVVKPLKKAKNKKNYNYSYRRRYAKKRGWYR